MKVLDFKQVLEKFQEMKRSSSYYVMYSSLWEGLVTDPSLMVLPVDDHMVHRGDAVFEAFRFNFGAFYDVDSHLARMRRSAASIELEIPVSDEEIRNILKNMAVHIPGDTALVRLFVSRGPGGFTTNPYETIGSQLYVILTESRPPSAEKYERGVSAMTSKISIKAEPWHQIKSCNYLPNVLMKKEAKDAGVDFSLSVSPEGYLAEGSTENVAFVIEGKLVLPSYEYSLRGTTLERVRALAGRDLEVCHLKGLEEGHVSLEQAFGCDEMFFIGTTLEVLPVSQLDGKVVGGGKRGPVAQSLRELLQNDMKSNAEFRLEP